MRRMMLRFPIQNELLLLFASVGLLKWDLQIEPHADQKRIQ